MVTIVISSKKHASLYKRKDNEMAEELKKYKDILKREREEFRRQLVREVGILEFSLF